MPELFQHIFSYGIYGKKARARVLFCFSIHYFILICFSNFSMTKPDIIPINTPAIIPESNKRGK